MFPDISRCQFPDISGYQIYSSFLKTIWPGLDMICNFWHFISILCPEAWDRSRLENRCIRTELWPQGANISLDSCPLGFWVRCGDEETDCAHFLHPIGIQWIIQPSVEKFYSCRVYLWYFKPKVNKTAFIVICTLEEVRKVNNTAAHEIFSLEKLLSNILLKLIKGINCVEII